MLVGEAMSPPVEPVRSDPQLPDRVGVVIIGGGIIGASTALFLAEKGHSVVLCEKGRDRRRAVQPQLGLVPHDGPRRARDPAGDRKPAALARHERAHRPRDRLPPGRHRLSVRDREGGRDAGGVAGRRRAHYQVDARLLRGAEIDALLPGASRMFVARACTRRPTAAPSRRTPRRRSPRRRGGGCDDADRTARCAASRRRADASPAWSPSGAASPATPRCWRAAPGRGCSAAMPGSTCRS